LTINLICIIYRNITIAFYYIDTQFIELKNVSKIYMKILLNVKICFDRIKGFFLFICVIHLSVCFSTYYYTYLSP